MANASSSQRVLVGCLYHETHSFVDGLTRLENCSIALGPDLLKVRGDASTLDGALEVAESCGWQVIPTVDVRAKPAATVANEVVDFWWGHYEPALREALAAGLDGIFLALHGAMVSESYRDVEGELLRRIRAITGPALPLTGVTDLHTNFTPAMAEHSNALITYRENPHTDSRAMAVRAARLLHRLMAEKIAARTYFAQPPLMWAPTVTASADEPMRGLELLAREIEAADADVLAVNIHAGYSFADTPHTGPSFTVVTQGTAERAHEYLRQLCDRAIANKTMGDSNDLTPDEAFRRIGELPPDRKREPIILVEPSDNIGAGAPGDGTGLLRELVERHIANAGAIICDPEAVAQIGDAAPGTRHHLSIGGKCSPLGGAPLEAEVELLSTSDGKFDLEDLHSHAAAAGMHINMGPCAVVRLIDDRSGNESTNESNPAGIVVLLTSFKTSPFDLGQWHSQGIEPADFDYIVVKAAVAHRQAYDKISGTSFTINTPGPCTSDLRALQFKHVRRPIYPLDTI